MTSRMPMALASLAGAGSVLHYVLTTGYGLRYYPTALWRYVVGAEYNVGAEMATEAMFVMAARFLTTFGLSWGAFSAIANIRVKRCPYCAEFVKAGATVCKHCSREVDGFEVRRRLTPGMAPLAAIFGLLVLAGLFPPQPYRTTLPWVGFLIAETLALIISVVTGL